MPYSLEHERLEDLRLHHILDTPNDGDFDDITHLAANMFDVPISIISLVDADRVWFKSAFGLEGVTQVDRGPGLCASAIMQDNVYIAEDLRTDPNSLANPLVARKSGFRFYAAAPLKSKNFHNLGTICLIDTKPRKFDANQADKLDRLSRLVMTQMEHRLAVRQVANLMKTVEEKNETLKHAASHDALTGLLNRRSIEQAMATLRGDQADNMNGAVLLLDVDHFKAVNDTFGHAAGDAVLQVVAERIRASVRPDDHVGRYGGEEFIVVLADCNPAAAINAAERIREDVGRTPVKWQDKLISVTISGGLCHGPTAGMTDGMLQTADKALYDAKRNGRNQIRLAA